MPQAAGPPDCSGAAAIRAALQNVARGRIVAIKGIGGFHLACDATSAAAVSELRSRKYREDKPFALMARDLEMVRHYCYVSREEAELLRSKQRPIVLLRKRPDCPIPDAVAPCLKHLGFMLPYSPIHHLLFEGWDRPLVMTSGNISDEPIAYRNHEAIERLRGIADSFLLHDRDIYIRCDDSVSRIFRGREYPIRRARGYVPQPIKLSFEFARQLLACGAELKNTFCLARRDYAFISQHIGDLENLQTLLAFEQGIEHFKKLFAIEPEAVAYDLHPEYLSTKYALERCAADIKIGIQHHHAHVVACMADNGLAGEVIGVAMDGLGYGTDGHFWGSEFLVASASDFERACHLDYVPMPGGVKALEEPWRMAAVYLHRTFGPSFLELDIPFVQGLNQKAWHLLEQMSGRGVNSPLTCGMGRLFDAVSSLLGLRHKANYEGQAAAELEMVADESCADSYRFELDRGGSIIRAEAVIAEIVEDIKAGVAVPTIAAKFHNAVADVIARVAEHLRRERGLERVVLSGGVFQNILLLEAACRRLEGWGFEAYVHHRVPPNDGGISLGQAVVADARIKAGRI